MGLIVLIPDHYLSIYFTFYRLLRFKLSPMHSFALDANYTSYLAEDSHEISSLIFSENQLKGFYKCRLLQSWLAL